MTDLTEDSLFGGRVVLRQPRGGYRVNVDALILAAFAAAGRPAKCACDLGSGVGGVGLSLLHLGGAKSVVMVEMDERAAQLAGENAAANGWADRVEVVNASVAVAARKLGGTADLLVCNPPYVALGRGRAPLPSRSLARMGDLATFVDAARAIGGERARACFVYPAIEATTLLHALRARGLEPKRARFVHARGDAPARVVLVEARPGRPGGLVVDAPLVEMHEGRASIEMAALLARTPPST